MLLPSPSIFFYRLPKKRRQKCDTNDQENRKVETMLQAYLKKLPKKRRQKYGMNDRQNGKVETMLQVYLKKLVGNAT
jgi:hypothetical protein